MVTETLILSPHHDDAVLSCGHWIERHPGAVVATVFCASPGARVPAGPWDRQCGFVTADQAAAGRAAEDLAALTILGATQRSLSFSDEQYAAYRSRTLHADLVRTIGDLLDEMRPQRFLFPLGARHRDHQLTARAAVAALAERPPCQAMAYADLPYAIISSPDRKLALARSGLLERHGERFTNVVQPSRKRDAAACYRSQLELIGVAYPRWSDCLVPGVETYWKVDGTTSRTGGLHRATVKLSAHSEVAFRSLASKARRKVLR
jgi:LmbE family N-acetylglucosaminyl deacetylase